MTGVRTALWSAGAPVRVLIVGLIRVYRVALSGWLGGQCRFYPSCSHYAEEAVRLHGAVRGTAMAMWRIARCGPFTQGGVDHVPGWGGAKGTHGKYDPVIHRDVRT